MTIESRNEVSAVVWPALTSTRSRPYAQRKAAALVDMVLVGEWSTRRDVVIRRG